MVWVAAVKFVARAVHIENLDDVTTQAQPVVQVPVQPQRQIRFPAGDYPLQVDGVEVGVIETFARHNGEVFGRLGFRDPAVYGMPHLDFDPRGKFIKVLQGNSVILKAELPAE